MRRSWLRLAAAVVVVAVARTTGGRRAAAREEAAGDRSPRRRGLSARPHAAGLRAGDRHRAPTTSSPTSCRPRTGILIARHEPNMIATTDVASRPKFASRRRTRDGRRRARARASSLPTSRSPRSRSCARSSRWPSARKRYDGKFKIPTLEEVLDLVERKEREQHRTIGVYPETKHPTYHQRLGLPLEGKLVAALKRHGLDHKSSAVFIQSFEQSNLKQLNRMTPVPARPARRRQRRQPGRHARLHGAVRPPVRLDRVRRPAAARTHVRVLRDRRGPAARSRTYADGIGPWKRYIVSSAAVDLNGDGTVGDENGDGLDRRGRPQGAAADRPHPARPQARPAHPHVDVPQRVQAAAVRLRRPPGGRVPAVLRAGHRRRVLRLRRHRASTARRLFGWAARRSGHRGPAVVRRGPVPVRISDGDLPLTRKGVDAGHHT